MIEARHSAAKARHAATSKTDRKRREDEEAEETGRSTSLRLQKWKVRLDASRLVACTRPLSLSFSRSLFLSLGQSVKAYTRRVAAASYHLGCLFTRATYTLDVSRDVGQAELVLDDLSIDTRRPERRRPPLLLTLSAPNFFFLDTVYTYEDTPFACKGGQSDAGLLCETCGI